MSLPYRKYIFILTQVDGLNTVNTVSNINVSLNDEIKNFKLKKVDKQVEVTLNINQVTSNTPSNTQEKTAPKEPVKSGGVYNNMLEEMKKVQLKKFEKVETTARPKINENERDYISNALSQAINLRRQQLNKNNNS